MTKHTKKRPKQNRKRQQSESEREEKVEGKCSHVKDAVKISNLTNKIPHADLTSCQECEDVLFNEPSQTNNTKAKSCEKLDDVDNSVYKEIVKAVITTKDQNETITKGEIGQEVSEMVAELSSALCVCLKCGFVGCSRQSKYKHASGHFEKNKAHAVVVNVHNWMVWCYQCDDELDPELNTDLKPCLALLRKALGVKESKGSEVIAEKKQKSNTGVCEKVVGVKGLTNLGNTCFFNSVMQNLCQIHLLRLAMKYLTLGEFKYRVQPSEQNLETLPVVVSGKHGPLSLSLAKFLEDMTEDSKKQIINPGNLFSEICKKAPRFKGFRQQDSQELLRYLLDAVRTEEIKTVKCGILSAFGVNKGPGKESDIIGSETHDKIRAYGKSACAPVIDSLFGGTLMSSVECLTCFKVFTIKESFFDLSLSLAADNQTVANKSKNTSTKKKEAPPKVFENKTRGKQNKTLRTAETPKTERVLSKHQQKKKAKAAKKEMKTKRRRNKSVSKSESHDPEEEKPSPGDEAPDSDSKLASTTEDLSQTMLQDPENGVACDQPMVVQNTDETVAPSTEESTPSKNESTIPQVNQPVSSQTGSENTSLSEKTSTCEQLNDKQEIDIDEHNSRPECASVSSDDVTRRGSENKLSCESTKDEQPVDNIDSNEAIEEALLSEVIDCNVGNNKLCHRGETNSNTDDTDKDINEISLGSQRLFISDEPDVEAISSEINGSGGDVSVEIKTAGKTDEVCTEGDHSEIKVVNTSEGSLDCPVIQKKEMSKEDGTQSFPRERRVDEQDNISPGSNDVISQVGGNSTADGDGEVDSGDCGRDNQPDTSDLGDSRNDNQDVVSGDVVIAATDGDNVANNRDGSMDSSSSGCGDSGFGGSSGDGTDNSGDSGINGEDNINPGATENENIFESPTITATTSEILSWNHSLKPMNATKYDTASVQECLKRFCTPEILDGDNSFICEHCNKRNGLEESDEEDSESGDEDGSDQESKKAKKTVFTEAVKQMLIHQPPPILTLHLKRFHQVMYSLRKLPKHIDFPVTLDIAPFCNRSSQVATDREGGVLYSLCGVVEHSGNLHSGHYTAYCRLAKPSPNFFQKSFENLTEFLNAMEAMWTRDSEDRSRRIHEELGSSKWYYISDSHVSGVTEEKVLKAQAYLLFYQRMALVQENDNTGNDELPTKES